MELCNLIKQIRQETGMSQTVFAEKIHVSFSTVNRWENGRAKPNRLATVTMIDLCNKENVSQELTDALVEFVNTVRS